MSISAEEIRKRAEEIRGQITEDRRNLHRIPELGMDLPQTSSYIRKRLDEMGIPWQDCGGDLPEKMTKDFMEADFPRMERAIGVTAVIGKGSPCILLRADMDALPIREESDLEFKSCNGYGHMCGHDSHAAMLLGAAQILKDMEDSLKGSVKLVFQPGEETGAGARMLVENGILENPKVDAAFGIHVQPVTGTGEAGYSVGVNSSSLDTFILKIKGRGGHSSQPQLCIDPLMIMNQVYQAVNLLVTREADPAAMVALTCGVAKGGTAVNIIPDEAEIVRKIFDMYLSGIGISSIAAKLNREALESDGRHWNPNAIRYILTNEKYIGDSLTQKHYTPPMLPLRCIRNKGERDKFYISNTHEAIISRKDFNAVQQLLSDTLSRVD